MKSHNLLTLILALTGLLLLAAADDPEPVECETCGMDWNISSTRLLATITADGKTLDHHYESLGCAFEALGTLGDSARLEGVEVLDYASYGTKSEQFLDAEDAVFLFDTEPLPGSMGPFIAAFASEEAAAKASRKLQGEQMDFDGVRAGIAGGAASSAGECNCPSCQAAREGN